MSLTSPGLVPPGWYPDPNGERQWRAWNGSNWSELTRPYGRVGPVCALFDSLALLGALDRLVRYGIGALFAGMGLVVGILAHWPGTAHPDPLWFAVIFSNAGVGLVLLGSLFFAFAARALDGHWSLAGVVPGLNVVVVAGLVTHRLTGRSAWRRIFTESVLLTFFVAQSHAQPWLTVIPVVVALEHVVSTTALIERLSNASDESALNSN